jgi:membrane-associated phospholipid phosphatase
MIRHYSQRYAALLALILAITASAAAQTPTPSTSPTPKPSPVPSLEREFFKNILRDQRAIWTSPLHLHREDAKWLAPLFLSTAALIATDRRTADALGDNRTRLNVSHYVSYLGSGYGTGGIAAAFYLVGRARDDARARETGLLGGEALIDSGIVAAVLKTSTQRPRPRAGKERGDFFDGGLSFPSGHTIAAWSLATVIANEYKDRPFVRFGAYGLAALVSASRFTGRNHFLSDVLVGSAIGYGIGRYVYKMRHDPNIDIDPYEGQTSGVRSRLFPHRATIRPQHAQLWDDARLDLLVALIHQITRNDSN